jgi:probable HAF family extracellular repeat protein
MARRRLLIQLLCIAALMAVVPIVSVMRTPGVRYNVTFLPSLGGFRTAAHSLNDLGQMVGISEDTAGAIYIYLWDKDQGFRTLGRYDDRPHFGGLCINNARQIAGTVYDPNGHQRAFLWELHTDPSGGLSIRERLLGTLGGLQSATEALNNRGQIVGHAETPQRFRHAFFWDSIAGMHDLGTLGGPTSVALDLNDAGQIVGFADTATGAREIVVWDPIPPAGSEAPPAEANSPPPARYETIDLGPAGVGPYVCQINNAGLVVRRFGTVTGKTYFFTWTRATGSRKLDFVAIDSGMPLGLNEAGQFLIQAKPAGVKVFGRLLHRRHECYLWDPDSGPLLLENRLSVKDMVHFMVRELNNRGQIAGVVRTKDSNQLRAVLLEPTGG